MHCSLQTLATRHASPVPRYTSYPTAPNFGSAVGPSQAAAWIEALPVHAALSLYVHIPFCRALCWYCGCTTTIANREQPIDGYVSTLEREMTAVSHRVPAAHRVTHIHWGGGSPNSLAPAAIESLAELTRDLFRIDPSAEFAVEIDPRFMDRARAAAFHAAGVNRVSIGVQDFDNRVQAAINRHQPYEVTRDVVTMMRDAGVPSINVDLVYGLPGQTQSSVAKTIDLVLALEPDRIAVFGYAHLPERIRRQRMIDTSSLPGPVERMGQASRIARKLIAAGYIRIGLDHFAKSTDPLAGPALHRNFQGYTTDTADALIGFGASAISRFPQGYAQNSAHLPDYKTRVEKRGLGTARGLAMSDDDRMRAHVIERLMCDLEFSESDLRKRFGRAAETLIDDARIVCDADQEGLTEQTADGFRVTERGRPFVRSICACFDAYLDNAGAIHSTGI